MKYKASLLVTAALLAGCATPPSSDFAARAGKVKHLDSWAARWWRGSISGALIEHAPCSVLVVITQ